MPFNPKSLENLKHNKPSHHDYGFRYSVPIELLDKLFALLANDISLSTAAKEVGIKFETAKKYFEEGDPRRSIKPLKTRLAVLRYKHSEKIDNLILKRKRYLLAIVRRLIRKLRKEIMDEDSTIKPSYSALSRLIQLEIELSKQFTTKEDSLSAMSYSAEDIKLLATRAAEEAEIYGKKKSQETTEEGSFEIEGKKENE